MPRQPRLDYEGAWHHVLNRGAGRRDVFRDDIDRQTFLDCLVSSSTATKIEIHGYCLMTNHFHILVASQAGELSDFMRRFAGSYSRSFNRRWRSDGPIFRGRALSIEIVSDAQLVATSRNIHLNPVAASLVVDAADWPWSSAAAYLERRERPDWLVTSAIQELFSEQLSGFDYASFLVQGVDARTARFYNELEWE